jgi:hypothetical protein
MSNKRKREESGPEYVLLQLQDTMDAGCTYFFYAKRDGVNVDKIRDPESDWALYTEEGKLTDGWTSLKDSREEAQTFTREHWCEVVTIDNE